MQRVTLTPLPVRRSRSRKSASGRQNGKDRHGSDSEDEAGRLSSDGRRRSHSPPRRAPMVRHVGRPWLRLPPKSLPAVAASRSEPNITRKTTQYLREYTSPYAAQGFARAQPTHAIARARSKDDEAQSVTRIGEAILTNLSLRVVKSSRRNKWLAPQKDVQAEDVALCMLATHKMEFEKKESSRTRNDSEDQLQNMSRESLLMEGSLDDWHLPPDDDVLRLRRASSVTAADEVVGARRSSTPTLSEPPSLIPHFPTASRQNLIQLSIPGGSTSDDDDRCTSLTSVRSQQSVRSQPSWRSRQRLPSRPGSPQLSSEVSFDEGSSTKSQFIALLFQVPACDILAGAGADGDKVRLAPPFTRRILKSWQASQPVVDGQFASGRQSPTNLSRLASSGRRSPGSLSPGARSYSALSSGDDDEMQSESGARAVSTRGAFLSSGLRSPLRTKSPKRKSKRRGSEKDFESLKGGQFYQAGMLDSTENMQMSDAARRADVKAMKERKIHFTKVLEVLKDLSGAKVKSVAELRKFYIRYCPPGSVQQTSALIGLDKALGQLQLHENFFDRILPDIVLRGIDFFSHFPRGQVPVMRRKEGKLLIQRVQAAALMAMTFLCGMPMNELSMAGLLCSQQQYQIAKLQCFIHYFDRLSVLGPEQPAGLIEFRRVEQEHAFSWSACAVPLRPIKICTDFVANQHGTVQVIASHRNIGAGVLHRGRGEEELLFCLSPELCVAMFVCQRVGASEAVVITGVERFSKYMGDGAGAYELKFAGDWRDPTPTNEAGNLQSCWLLIDPTKFDKDETLADQMESAVMRRDLNKCFTGFDAAAQTVGFSTVSINDWGCDPLFRGSIEVKALLLWMAASTASRRLRLVLDAATAHAEQDTTHKLHLLIEGCMRESVTVAQLFDAVTEASMSQPRPGFVLPLIMHLLHLDRSVSRTASSDSSTSHARRLPSSSSDPTGAAR